jgi:hypothetical protein
VANPVGRPTKYNEELQELADSYVFRLEELGHAVPSRVGLCCFIGIHKATSYEWESLYPEFSDTLKRVETLQEHMSINGGLMNKLNPTIVKLLLANFGYSDKVQQEHTSPDGSMTPKPALDVSKLSSAALEELVNASNADD